MSVVYVGYLTEHIANVNNALDWMASRGIIENKMSIGLGHDESKYSGQEYQAYDDYFYGNDNKTKEEIDQAFDYAWLHHIHNNKHHWQYWILHEDEGSVKALEMPEEYVYEMIADWWSFSWKADNLYEIFNWYEDHKNKIILHPNTRTLVESTLSTIKEKLDNSQEIEYSLLQSE